jgi:hypothetical protein
MDDVVHVYLSHLKKLFQNEIIVVKKERNRAKNCKTPGMPKRTSINEVSSESDFYRIAIVK